MVKKTASCKFVFTLLLAFGLFVFWQAQKFSDKVEDLYNRTEQIYCTDDLLVNGQIYVASRSRAKGSPFFGEKRFEKGSVNIKGREFNGVLLKYDLEAQRLILRATVENEKYVTIVLNSRLIDAFRIGGQQFVNAEHYLNDAGFYAQVYEGRFTFLIKFKKSFRAVYDTQTPNGSYTGLKSDYFIFNDGNLENLTNKKALLNYFSPVKNEVKSFMRKNKISYKKASMAELNQLMKYCDSISVLE